MLQVSVSKLRTNLMEFLLQAQRGREIAVTSCGRVVARISPPSDSTEQARKARMKPRSRSKVGDVLTPDPRIRAAGGVETIW
jgi:antitoxin (DNA-binding transcriptional repressor) of toxin-antitoxin stability system